MICINCRNEVVDGVAFCPHCGTNFENINTQSDVQHHSQKQSQPVQYNEQFDNNSKETTKNKKKRKTPIIIIILIIVILIGSFGYVGIQYLEKNKKKEKPTSDIAEKEELEQTNTLEKLKMDYESGILSVNDYFNQLVYLEYDSSQLDQKYVSNYYSTECEFDTDMILDQYFDELDQDIIRFYLTNKSMANVSLGYETTVNQTNNNVNYEVKLLKDEIDKGNAFNHRLNKVYLSQNGNFLIWYTDIGDDAITDEQLQSIATGLENTISLYEQKFGIKYSYNPYIDNKYFNEDWKNAKETLTQNHISTSVLQAAMSVYVYDTGSNSVLASYIDQQDAAKWINRSLILDILDEDGIINYPYIVINRNGFENNESLVQLYNHELFHHMQYLYCTSTNGKRCVADVRLTESIANFASSLVSDVSTSNNFLNNWASTYTKNTSVQLSEITDKGGSLGYAIFPYFNSYSSNVNNWATILIEAHNQEKPFEYIQSNTPKEDLINTINDLAYRTISQNYTNKSLISNTGITNKKDLTTGNYNLTINPGSIDYFELDTIYNLKVTTNQNDYLTIKIYGYKNGKYKEIKSELNTIELDTAFYVNYDKFYLAVTNGNLINSYDYTIHIENSKYQENSEFITTFDNYNIEVTMNLKISGIESQIHSKGIVDELHQKEYLDFDTTTMGFMISNKIYYDFNTGYTYMTQPYGGDVWWKEKGTSQMVDLGNILNKLISMNNVTKISEDHYKVNMTNADIKGLISSANADTSTIKGNVSVDVYTNNGYITKLYYDFSNLISDFEVFNTTINFSDYNQAGDVEIPQTIIENAKSM